MKKYITTVITKWISSLYSERTFCNVTLNQFYMTDIINDKYS